MFSKAWNWAKNMMEWAGERDNGSQNGIKVHKDTEHPTKAWEKLQVKQRVESVPRLDLSTPIFKDKIRFVCLSDTHGTEARILEHVPNGDVLLHTGDFTMVGQPKQVVEFNEFLGALPHRHKIVICGNHELTFDPKILEEPENLDLRWHVNAEKAEKFLAAKGVQRPQHLLTNCTYLEDSEAQVYGLRIYGSPWTPTYGNWAFNADRGQPCLDKWNLIPEGIDILLTHGPPIGHGDLCYDGIRAGCVELLSSIQQRIHPKYHVFGHIHEGPGVTTDGLTTYINASTCNLRYQPRQPPILFDIPLPEGTKKEDFGPPVVTHYGLYRGLGATSGGTASDGNSTEEPDSQDAAD